MIEREFEDYLALLRGLLRLRKKQCDAIADELRDHMDARLEDLLAEGIPKEKAVQIALEEFGDAAGVGQAFLELNRTNQRRWNMKITAASLISCTALGLATMAFWPDSANHVSSPAVAQEGGGPGASAGPGAFTGAPPPQERTKEENNLATAKKLAQIQEQFDINEIQIIEVAEMIGRMCNVNVIVDRAKLEESSVDVSKALQISLKNVRIDTALELTLKQLGDCSYYIHDGIVMITSQEAMSNVTEVRVYNVADLVYLDSSWPLDPRNGGAPSGMGGIGGMGGMGGSMGMGSPGGMGGSGPGMMGGPSGMPGAPGIGGPGGMGPGGYGPPGGGKGGPPGGYGSGGGAPGPYGGEGGGGGLRGAGGPPGAGVPGSPGVGGPPSGSIPGGPGPGTSGAPGIPGGPGGAGGSGPRGGVGSGEGVSLPGAGDSENGPTTGSGEAGGGEAAGPSSGFGMLPSISESSIDVLAQMGGMGGGTPGGMMGAGGGGGAMTGGGGMGGMGGGLPPKYFSKEPKSYTPEERRTVDLMQAITSAVEWETWANNGNGGVGEVQPFEGLLIIRNTPKAHQGVEMLLQQIRAARLSVGGMGVGGMGPGTSGRPGMGGIGGGMFSIPGK